MIFNGEGYSSTINNTIKGEKRFVVLILSLNHMRMWKFIKIPNKVSSGKVGERDYFLSTKIYKVCIAKISKGIFFILIMKPFGYKTIMINTMIHYIDIISKAKKILMNNHKNPLFMECGMWRNVL